MLDWRNQWSPRYVIRSKFDNFKLATLFFEFEKKTLILPFFAGWFPAKLVEVLDERSKEYSYAGDDSVTQAITDIIRGVFCPAVKRVLEHGLRQ